MGLRIATNVPSLATQRNVETTSGEAAKSFARMSSGQRITKSGDDAAGLAIATNLEATTRGLKMAQRNANDGISFVQTAEGGINEVSNILVRMRELSVQSASDTVGDTERGFLNKETQSLKQEIDRISAVTNYNGTSLLSGEGKELSFQVGTQAGEMNQIKFDPSKTDVRAGTLGVSGIDMSSKDGALDGLAMLDNAITKVNSNRSELGAMQNRLHSSANSIGISVENLSEARSRIADTDMAEESSKLAKNSILQNAGISVLGQANSSANAALKLL
ncbi:MAG: flagellin FliC [Proteobacteria bacterium]|nr:MAG: flagellin FliC [Pseudomonadota bacterium]